MVYVGSLYPLTFTPALNAEQIGSQVRSTYCLPFAIVSTFPGASPAPVNDLALLARMLVASAIER